VAANAGDSRNTHNDTHVDTILGALNTVVLVTFAVSVRLPYRLANPVTTKATVVSQRASAKRYPVG
jgi:hypothetical protein